MSTDALVLDRPGSAPLFPEDRELHRLHLPNGRSYVVFAKGQLFARQAPRAHLRLEAFDDRDEASFFHLAPGEQISAKIGEADPLAASGQASFSLAIAVTLPAEDPDLFVVARLFGSAALIPGVFLTSGAGRADVRNVKIIALALDSVTMA
jgi:hypothetical protein